MLSQIRWHQPNAETNPFEYLNFARWYMHWWNGRQMDQYIGGELDKRCKEYKADPGNKRGKAVIDLVLQAHQHENKGATPHELDKEFRTFAIRQIRLFVFAGHDSTSSTICYIFYLLSANHDALSLLRAEHDEVLGTDTTAAPSLLESSPQTIESLPYTLAVIKEALRLFTPAGCSRRGKPNVNVLDDEDNVCPTDEAMVWMVHVEMHRSPKYWKRTDEFLPERWTVEPGHELYPMKGAVSDFAFCTRNFSKRILTDITLTTPALHSGDPSSTDPATASLKASS